MPDWQPLPGRTMLVPSGPAGLHLFVLILGPVVVPSYGSAPQVVMVSATSIRNGVPHDPACELLPGDHAFIQHPSFIAYRYLRIDRCVHVEQMVNQAVWVPHEPCSELLLQRVVVGVCRSRLAPREFKKLFGCL